MSKKVISKECEQITDWYLERISIEDVIENLNLHKDLGVTHLELDLSYENPVIRLYIEREETDYEYRQRLHQEDCDRDFIERHELKLLAELKAKYPDN
jgi:HSP20 family molecular chaperone IbpA